MLQDFPFVGRVDRHLDSSEFRQGKGDGEEFRAVRQHHGYVIFWANSLGSQSNRHPVGHHIHVAIA